MKNWLTLGLFIVLCELAGLLATPVTMSAIPTWYAYLNKPWFSPPNWLFGPVWGILYLLMGVAFYQIFSLDLKQKKVREACDLFLIQLGLNFLWSISFFGFRSPLLGLINILILWVLILVTLIRFYKLKPTAGYLLLPYLVWVSFATLLNAEILRLN